VSYVSSDYYVICDECGGKFRSSQTRMRWDKARVCRKDWETRHPQDFVRGRADKQAVPNPRSEPSDVFLDDNDVTASDL